MSRALSRTEKTTRRAPWPTTASAPNTRGSFTRLSRVKVAQLTGRLACGLLAAMHIAPLLRVSRNILEQGPTPALLATWAALVLLIGVLAAKAAGRVFFPAGSRRVSLVALVLAAALFHGDVVLSKDAAPTTFAVLVTTGATVVIASHGRELGEHLAGIGPSFNDLFPMTLWARLSGEPAPRPLCFVGLCSARPRGPPVRSRRA